MVVRYPTVPARSPCSPISARRWETVTAAELYELLLPYRDLHVVIGLGAICQGSVARHLGTLAACAGSRQLAREHFEEALTRNRALRAPVCVGRTQLDYGRALGRGARAGELVRAAARTADELQLPWLARRAAQLRSS